MTLGKPTPDARRYLYVDGGAVRGAIKVFSGYFEGDEIQINWESVGANHERIFYYDALPVKKEPEESEVDFKNRVAITREKFDSMRKLRGFFVNYGVSLRRRQRIEQKRVDTMIATDILTHAHRQLAPEISLITNDQDFYPVVLAAMDTGVKVNLICQSQKTNKEFMYATDSVEELSLEKFHKWTTPQLQRKHPLPTIMINTRSNRRISRTDQQIFSIAETTDKGYEISIENVVKHLRADKLSILRKYVAFKYEQTDSVLAALKDLDILIENNETV